MNDMDKRKEEYFELLLEIKDEIEKFAVFLTRNRDTAKDILGDVIISGYYSYLKLNDKNSFKSYMMKICLRTYYKYIGRNKKLVEIEDLDINTFYPVLNQEELLDIKLLYEAIDKLKKKEKNVILLAELMGYKHQEVANITGISISNVKVIIFRSKKKLKQLLLSRYEKD